MNASNVPSKVFLLIEPLGTDAALPVFHPLVDSLNVSLHFVVIGKGFLTVRTNSRILRRLSLVSVNKSDVSFQLLYPHMTNRALLLIFLSLVQMNDIDVFPQISGCCKPLIAFLAHVPFAHFMCLDMFGQAASLAKGLVADVAAMDRLLRKHGTTLCSCVSQSDMIFLSLSPL